MPESQQRQHATAIEVAPFTVDGSPEGTRWRLRFAGELDLAGIQTAEAALASALRARCSEVVIDLSRLTFIDSTGLRFVIRARTACSEADRHFTIRQGGPAIQRIFELTRLDAFLPFEH